jgi:mRNA-degrading endonuclease RelE of RelBE toxin-antitoxin system
LTYYVDFSSPATRAAAALDAMVTEYVGLLAVHPRPLGAKRVGEAGRFELWRLRVGSTRILYRIDESAKKVTVMGITRRRDPYTS